MITEPETCLPTLVFRGRRDKRGDDVREGSDRR